MSKNKKERKESASDDEESSSSDSSSDAIEEKTRKHAKKSKHKQRKKTTTKKKKNSKRSSSESADSSSDSTSSSTESSSSESEVESSHKKRANSKQKKTVKKIETPVQEIKKHKSPESSRSRDVERREPAHSSSAREHNVFRHGGEEKQRRWSKDRRSVDRRHRSADRLDKSTDRRNRSVEKRDRSIERRDRSADRRDSRERDFGERIRGRERDQAGWSGAGRAGERRANFQYDHRNYGREQRFADRRDDRDRNTERHFEQRAGQREDWHNRARHNERRDRSRSPRHDNERGHRERRNSPARQRPSQRQRQRRQSDNESYEWGKRSDNEKAKKEASPDPADKEKPNFALSGALTEDANKVNGVVVKYAEPPEARKPKRRWRLYPFKGETALPTLHIHRQSCFLVGRDRKVVDLAVDHPSCSKQHAALQYRLVPFERDDGTTGKRVRLYLIDLESANGTFLNNKQIEARKYYELIEKDVIKFGFSTREYVLLHENSKEDQEDDDVDVKQEPEDVAVIAPTV